MIRWQHPLLLAGLLLAGTVRAGTVETGLALQSPMLGRPIPYSLYRPDHPAGKLPVLFLLHGLRGNELDWTGPGDLGAVLDQAITAGRIKPLIAVMPGVGNSWYVDDPRPDGFGPVTRALEQEFIPAIPDRHGTLACPAGQAIGGLSMGGYGALLLGLRQPGRFSALISLSGSIFDPLPTDPQELARRPMRMFSGIFGTPIDPAQFNPWTLYHWLAAYPAAAVKPPVWIMAGRQDYPTLLAGAGRFAETAQARGWDVALSYRDGGHDWANWTPGLAEALPWLDRHLAATCP